MPVDVEVGGLDPDEYDGLVIPGGWMPDKLRRYAVVRDFVAAIHGSRKPIGIICHGGLIAISAGIVAGSRATGSLGHQGRPRERRRDLGRRGGLPRREPRLGPRRRGHPAVLPGARRRPRRLPGRAVARAERGAPSRPPFPVVVNLRSIGVPFAWWREQALRLEAAGYAGVATWDHFVSRGDRTAPVLEAWTTLAVVGGATRSLGLMTFVANVMNRHPAVLARMAATLQEATGGRLTLGIGIGGHPAEHHAYGIPFPDAPERVARLEEAVAVLRALWAGGPGDAARPVLPARRGPCVPGSRCRRRRSSSGRSPGRARRWPPASATAGRRRPPVLVERLPAYLDALAAGGSGAGRAAAPRRLRPARRAPRWPGARGSSRPCRRGRALAGGRRRRGGGGGRQHGGRRPARRGGRPPLSPPGARRQVVRRCRRPRRPSAASPRPEASSVTTTSRPAPPAPVPTHRCVRCGAEISVADALCRACNPAGLKQPAASQAHGTVFLGIALAVIAMAVVATFLVGGVGPFRSSVRDVDPGRLRPRRPPRGDERRLARRHRHLPRLGSRPTSATRRSRPSSGRRRSPPASRSRSSSA